MADLRSLLEWVARQANVQMLEISKWPEEGFQAISISFSKTSATPGDFVYGIAPEFAWRELDDTLDSAKAAYDRGYLSGDFPGSYFDRARRIALDLRSRSEREGFEFYNGKLAKLKAVSIRKGRSPSEQILELQVGYTSYLSAIGTNIYFGGFKYRYAEFPDESQLSRELKWPLDPDWHTALSCSPLANALAMHIFLYNDNEILYVQRARVGQQSGKWNSTVNGVMEFSKEYPDLFNDIPDIGSTARRETMEELNLKIDPAQIHWIGLGATLDRCEPFVVGVYKISMSKGDLSLHALLGQEQREVSDISVKGYRRKAIRAISTRDIFTKEDLGLGPISVSLPFPKQLTRNLKELIRKKIILRQDGDEKWTDEGAVSLMLCLAHLCERKALCQVLADLRNQTQDGL